MGGVKILAHAFHPSIPDLCESEAILVYIVSSWIAKAGLLDFPVLSVGSGLPLRHGSPGKSQYLLNIDGHPVSPSSLGQRLRPGILLEANQQTAQGSNLECPLQSTPSMHSARALGTSSVSGFQGMECHRAGNSV